MTKKFNFVAPLLERLLQTIQEQGSTSVIWLGNHPWLPVIIEVLLDIGISDIRILSNREWEQGLKIEPFTWGIRHPDCSIEIEPVFLNDEDKDSTFFMANTHYLEFSWQLSVFGILPDQIINLYDLSCDHILFWKQQEERVKNLDLLSGRQLQMIELNTLIYFRDYCKKKNLTFFIGAGTLLGAIRHQGFIPWDDDLDVYMPYEDYLRLIEEFEDDERYELLDWRRDDNYIIPFAQLTDKTTYLIREYPWMYCCGVTASFIDIFPLSGYPADAEGIEAQWEKNLRLDREWYYYMIVKDVSGFNVKDERQRISDDRHSQSFYLSDRVGNVIRTNHRPWSVSRGAFETTVSVRFENEYFPAPIGYDEYLKARYDNYMRIPDETEKERHGFPTYSLK